MGRYITPILLLVIAIGSFVVFTNPMYTEIKTLQAEESSYSNALANSLKLQELRDVLIGQQNNFSSQDVMKLEQMIPSSVDNIKLAIELQKIGEARGLSVESVQYDPKTSEASQGGFVTDQTEVNNLFETFELEIIAKGSYDTFVGFLEEVQQNLRIVDVTNIEFSSETSLLNTNTYTYNVIIKTYRLKD